MRVLIVEDDPVTRELRERGLREESFEVMVMSDASAVEASAAARAFDVIVLDVVLPGADGFRCAAGCERELLTRPSCC